MTARELIAALSAEKYDEKLTALYGAAQLDAQRARYIRAAKEFSALYGEDREVNIYSVPGRSEISGNHTDHNHGRVLAAAIGLDIIAVASPCAQKLIRVKSEGFDEDKVDISALSPEKFDDFTSGALIAGMCAGFGGKGYAYGGFDAYTTNNVYKGSGLSSSAAFEVMIGNILNHIYNCGRISAPEIAKLAQYSENVYFGKPCGLMDQTACAVGGFVAIDFADPSAPIIEKMDYDLTKEGYTLCITNTGGNHADLNADYASVPAEMKSVAKLLGAEVLRGFKAQDIISNVPMLRKEVGDRSILRALHFIGENDRVAVQTEALRRGDTEAFLDGVTASGRSSFIWLQNVYTTKNISEQGLSLALAVSEQTLAACGKKWAVRVHGGGFAGTIQAFVPAEFTDTYKKALDAVFGENACTPLAVRPEGAIKVL